MLSARKVVKMVVALLFGIANAGSGPWVPGTGVANVYLGIDAQHWGAISGTVDGTPERIEIGDGVGSLGLVAITSYGISSRLELEGRIPWRTTHVAREDQQVCADLGTGTCRTTRGIGVLEARLKALVLDELSGAPLSLALGVDLRFGGLTAPTRSRLTNIGEGTTDFGPRVTLGRTGAIGSTYIGASLDASGFYRVPNTRSYPLSTGDRAVPGSEISGELEVFVTPLGGIVTVAPFAYGLYRPGGVDFSDLVVEDTDRFTALRIGSLTVGGKLLLRDARNHVFVLSAGRTVAARNNPSDQFVVGLGVSLADVLSVFDRRE